MSSIGSTAFCFAVILLECSRFVAAQNGKELQEQFFQTTSRDKETNSTIRDDCEYACRNDQTDEHVICEGVTSCKYPRRLFHSVKYLTISNLRSKMVSKDDFLDNLDLEELVIEESDELRKIYPAAFSKLKNLKALSIMFNKNLRSINAKAFLGLDKLQILKLINNPLLTIIQIPLSIVPSIVPKLISLDLSENEFTRIDEAVFSPLKGSTIKELKLVFCNIEYIHPQSLTFFNKLEALYIDQNHINTSMLSEVLLHLSESKIHLNTLSLLGTGINHNPPLDLLTSIGRNNISKLILSRNEFHRLTSNSFPVMPQLKSLELSSVLLSSVEYEAFTSSNMPNLQILDVSYNFLEAVTPGLLHHNLKTLNASFNTNPDYNFNLGSKMFINMSVLEHLILKFTKINEIFNDTFQGLIELNYLDLKNCSLTKIEYNSFSWLPNLKHLDLSNNFLEYSLRNGDVFRNNSKLENLILSNNQISDLSSNIFTYLNNIKYINLEDNYLTTLDPKWFLVTKRLLNITLRNNNIIPWNEPVFTNAAAILNVDISDNNISFISCPMLDDLSLFTTYDLQRNPLVCKQATFTVLEQKRLNSLIMLGVPSLYCSGEAVISNDESLFCSTSTVLDNISSYWIIIPSLLLLLIIGLSLLLYIQRSFIHYLILLRNLRQMNNNRSNKKTKDSRLYEFDACVCYSTEDKNFVIGFASMLENYQPYLKVVVSGRDFQAEGHISHAVHDTIAKCRHVVFILSDSFMRTQWLVWEREIIKHTETLFKNGERDSLIFVKVGQLQNTNSTPIFKFLSSTCSFLEWNSESNNQDEFCINIRRLLKPM